MKKIIASMLVLVLILGAMIGCSTGNSETNTEDQTTTNDTSGEVKELVMMVNFGSEEAVTIAIEEAIKDFETSNQGIKIKLIPGNKDYENIMKTKMGSNDLPDIWTTHGWSVARYSEYLMPLTDQNWVEELNPGIKNVITDKNGDVYVLPTDVDLSGIAYNKTVLEASGVKVDSLKTWDDFMSACEQIKTAGYTPIHMGGKDIWPVGNFFDWVAPSMLITDESSNYRTSLKDGSFEWSNWNQVSALMKEFGEKEYFNVDKLSSTYIDSAKNLAQDKAAFAFYGNYVIAEAWKYNAEADLGFMPVPSKSVSDEPTLISGERTAFGIWKDTEYSEEAIKFLNYLSKPEVMSKLASANTLPAGLKNVASDTGKLKADYAKYANVRGFPYFDREYLPSGMWETLCSTGTGILSGSMTPEETSREMEKNYNRLLEQ